MKSFSYAPQDFDGSLCYDIYQEVSRLQRYFYKFCGRRRAPEAMQATIYHAMTHYAPERGNLTPYIKKLAREIMKDNGRIVPVDFLDQTVSDGQSGSGMDMSDAFTNLSHIDDISKNVIEKITMENADDIKIVELALEFMHFFVLLCDSLLRKDTDTLYFPDSFIDASLKIQKEMPDFSTRCLNLYSKYKTSFEKFLSVRANDKGSWREADCGFIQYRQSKRVKLVDENGVPYKDADSVDSGWGIWGKCGDKRVLRVPYLELYNILCDLIDEDGINVVKFTIGYSYIIRTLGGSLSVINPILAYTYQLCKDEILTNVLFDLNARVLNVGSSHIYLLVENAPKYAIEDRVIGGIPIHFDVEDITDSCVEYAG